MSRKAFIDDTLETQHLGSLGPISTDYFRDELGRFREVIGSTAYTLEQKDLAFRAIALLAMNLDQKDPKCLAAESWWEVTALEWSRRRFFELMRADKMEQT